MSALGTRGSKVQWEKSPTGSVTRKGSVSIGRSNEAKKGKLARNPDGNKKWIEDREADADVVSLNRSDAAISNVMIWISRLLT